MVKIKYPEYTFKMKEAQGKELIWDDIRKKWVRLTPEEWVRQHFVQFLINQKGYPKSLIKLEGGLKLFGKARRTDIVVFNTRGERILIIECKAPSVKITQKTFDQVARYNMVHQVSMLGVSNGLVHYYCSIDTNEKHYRFIEELPAFSEINN